MKNMTNALQLSVRCTIALLLSAGMLIVLGIFNESLRWDIFSPNVEHFLYAIFGTCIALACVGVAITLVISSSEAVRMAEALLSVFSRPVSDQASSSKYLLKMTSIICTSVCLIVSAFGVANWFVQKQRQAVYRQVAEEQFKVFAPRLSYELKQLTSPPQNKVPPKIFEYIKALDDIPAFSNATLYIPDPKDKEALWGFTAWRGTYADEDGFARFYVVKAFEKAMQKALQLDSSKLMAISNSSNFEWYGVINDDQNKPIGILRLDGNSSEDFRSYQKLD